MAELSGKILGLQEEDVLEVTNEDFNIGIGKIGFLKQEMTLTELCESVKAAFCLPNVKLFGDKEAKVKRVAISPGSGRHMSSIALQKGADVLVTGDIDHHEGIDAVSQGLAIIDAGHYGLEHIFITDIAKYLKEYLVDVEVEQADIVQPFQVI